MYNLRYCINFSIKVLLYLNTLGLMIMIDPPVPGLWALVRGEKEAGNEVDNDQDIFGTIG
jgi:hypothetical protein